MNDEQSQNGQTSNSTIVKENGKKSIGKCHHLELNTNSYM